MKKIVFILSSVLMLTFVSCAFQLPKSIKVKTNADYNFNVLKFEKDFGDMLSLQNLVGSVSGDNSVELYEYNPGGSSKAKQMLISMPFEKIPLDFSEYLDSMDFTVDAMSFDQSLAIPEVSFSQEKVIDVEYVKTFINGMVTFTGKTYSSESGISFIVDDGAFDKIVYNSGKIIVISAQPDGVCASLSFKDKSKHDGYFYSGEAEIYLPIGSELTANGMSIQFSGDDLIPDLDFIATIDSDSEIASAHGITITLPQKESFNQNLDLNLSDTVKSFVVEQGELSVGIGYPDNWHGVNLGLEGKLTGAMNVELEKEGPTSLAGVAFDSSKSLSFTGDISATFDNAELYFDSDTTAFKTDCKIESLREVTAVMPDGFDPTTSFEQPLSSEISKVVKKITWKPSGIAVSMETNLPEENKFTINNINSNFFGVNASDKELSATPVEFYCADGYETVFASDTKIDFAVTLGGFDIANRTMTLKNIKTGTSYDLKINVEPKIDWFKIVIDPSVLSDPQKGSFDSGFDQGSLFQSIDDLIFEPGSNDSLSKHIELKSIPVYLFCNIPDIISGLSFTGVVNAYLGTGSGDNITKIEETDTYLLGSKEGPGVLKTVSDFKIQKNDEGIVTDDVSAYGVTPVDFKEFIWKYDDVTLFVDFSIALTGDANNNLTIVNPAYESEAGSEDKILTDGNNNIEITAVIPVSLEFDITEPFKFDLMKFMGSSEGESEGPKDILNREGPMTDLNKVLDAIESVEITYTPTKLPVGYDNTCPLSLDLGLVDISNPSAKKSIYSQNLKLHGDTVKLDPYEIMNTWPLEAEAKVVFDKGNLYIPHEMGFATTVILGVHTNGLIDISDITGKSE